ncbi:unnamed protein product [Nesidiocoris tenuis]|uniref:Uncharacterized protein n=1 Tax=Nesidiocoris tenuis TaxID=355587 RepID=A0A6H5H6L5_9HEMI|nr:unnamed protein product [Nesidiocoris tenuis]
MVFTWRRTPHGKIIWRTFKAFQTSTVQDLSLPAQRPTMKSRRQIHPLFMICFLSIS